MALWEASAQGLVVIGATRALNTCLDFNTVVAGKVVDPLQVATQVLPTALVLAVVVQRRLAEKMRLLNVAVLFHQPR